MPVLDPVTSPESPKGTSPYPGPSGSLKKNKLAGKVKSPAALSPVPKTSPVCQSAKQPKRRYRKRCASPAFTSPPKLKKVCTGTGKAGETDAAGGDINVTSSTAEQSSSPSSSEGEIPLAWMKIEEERKQNKMKKRKYKTKWSKTKSVKSVTNGQGLEAPALNADSTANSYMAEAETSTQLALEAKISQKDSTPGNGILSSTKQKRKQMSLGAPLVVSDKMFRPGPASKTKRKSLDEDKKQTLLTNWFTKVQQKNKETPPKTRAGVVKLKPNELKPTKPVLIEWKGKQLVILSPKVLLKRNEIFDKFKPRNLDIDMNDRKGCIDSNKEISMLACLESDVRLTRKRLDLGLQESGDWTEIEIPILSKPKSLEMDKTGSKGLFEKEVELLASLDIEKRITRKMLDSEMPTLTALCHDQKEMSPQKPKRKRKKHKVVSKEPSLFPEMEILNEDKNSVDNKSIGALENKAEKVLGKNVDLAQKNNRLIVPAETVHNAKEQFPKLKSLEKDKLSLNCGADNKKNAGSNFARKGLDGSTKTLSLPHTPPAKKSEQFVYPDRSKSDSKKEAILLSQNISFVLPKSFSFIHDSPAKNLRMRKTPEAIAQESSLELFNKTEVKIKTETTEMEIKLPIDANRGIPNLCVAEPMAHKNKSQDISGRDSPSKNLRKRSHISYSVTSPRLTKRQENMSGLPVKRMENEDQQKRTVQWYCEGTRQIDTVHFESENVCPNIQLSNHQNELHMLKMPLESSDQTKKCIPYSSVSLSPDSENGDKSSDCKTAMNLSPSYFTKFRGTDSKALDNSGTSTSSEGEEIAGIENVPKEFSARRHIKALSDLHKSYMNSLSPDRFILDF
ncbi:hypothetical protein DPMN_094892 [Dreissena polymorpha]|uniref:Uncharacterized protein n=2 Tax=Dreissena polymorpha TaxID=45954 RepID=A0A9D4L6J4_DREPO|nr:hypothetical protein DPMN_094892 [Dreissena polymorpha]